MKSKKQNKIRGIFDLRYLFYDFVKITGVFPAMLLLRLKKYHFQKRKQKNLFKGPVIVVSNHVNYFDILILLTTFWFRRVSFIAKDELFNKKIGKLFFTLVKANSIQNSNINIKTFKRAINELDRGHLVGIFPEGHVKTQEGIDEFKDGAVLLSLITNVPIVCVYIKEKKNWYHRQRVIIGNKFEVSKIINSSKPTIEEIKKVTKMLYEHENELARDIDNQIMGN